MRRQLLWKTRLATVWIVKVKSDEIMGSISVKLWQQPEESLISSTPFLCENVQCKISTGSEDILPLKEDNNLPIKSLLSHTIPFEDSSDFIGRLID